MKLDGKYFGNKKNLNAFYKYLYELTKKKLKHSI